MAFRRKRSGKIDKIGEGGLRGANSYKISKSWGCNTQHRNIVKSIIITKFGDIW